MKRPTVTNEQLAVAMKICKRFTVSALLRFIEQTNTAGISRYTLSRRLKVFSETMDEATGNFAIKKVKGENVATYEVTDAQCERIKAGLFDKRSTAKQSGLGKVWGDLLIGKPGTTERISGH